MLMKNRQICLSDHDSVSDFYITDSCSDDQDLDKVIPILAKISYQGELKMAILILVQWMIL